MWKTILSLTIIGALTALMAQAPPAGGRGATPPTGRGGGLAVKDPALPANLFTSSSTLAYTQLRHEWVDITVGTTKLHTWIEYPSGDAKAPVVLLIHYDAGLDDLQRALADQLATEGFIAVAPDFLSGLGPGSGNYDSFRYRDDALRALAKLQPDEFLRRSRGAFDYAKNLPRANGKFAVLGCGLGGTNSFRLASKISGLNAAVVFYGLPPSASEIARIQVPVLGLYGGDDDAVIPTLEQTDALMKKNKKTFESHVYAGGTHFFLTYQFEGRNTQATAEAWPTAMAFLKKHLQIDASTQR